MSVVMVTGANRGIGLELCRGFVERGDQVIAVCRQSSAALDALDVQVEAGVDLRSDEAVLNLAKRLVGLELDVLLHNAGILMRSQWGSVDMEMVREQFEVNSIGPVRLTQALRHHVRDGAKIGIVTSRMGSIGDNTSGGYYGYRMSKAAACAAGVSLARDLASRGISVALLHPGFVRTEMTGGRGLVDPPESAAGLMARMDELTLENSGTFWHANGEVLPW